MVSACTLTDKTDAWALDAKRDADRKETAPEIGRRLRHGMKQHTSTDTIGHTDAIVSLHSARNSNIEHNGNVDDPRQKDGAHEPYSPKPDRAPVATDSPEPSDRTSGTVTDPVVTPAESHATFVNSSVV